MGPAGNADLLIIYRGFQSSLPIEIRSVSGPRLQVTLPTTANGLLLVQMVSASGGFSEIPLTSITWTSSDESIATVNAAGKVTGHRPGNVRIIATRNGLSDFYWMSVPPRSK
jgi:hypothetical protein